MINNELKQAVKAVQMAKADKAFWGDVKTYGGTSPALRALDSISIEEAVEMLAVVQPFSIFKRDGKVVVQ